LHPILLTFRPKCYEPKQRFEGSACAKSFRPLNDAAGNNYGITGLKYHPATGTLWSFVANCAKIAVVARGLDGTVNAQETGERVVRAARVPPNLEK